MNLAPQGFAILCDEAGRFEIIRDEGELCGKSAGTFEQLVDLGSSEKARSFLKTIRDRKAAFGWEMNVPVGERPTTFQFAGSVAGDRSLVIGGATSSDVTRLSEDLIAMNSEQTAALRSALKDLSLFQRERAQRDAQMFDELSRLNNDLVTLQRELHQKNRELEKLNNLKNAFLGMASHDLRKPMGVALMNVESLLTQADGPLTESQKTQVGYIGQTCRQVTRQLNDFLDIAQIESGRLKLNRADWSLGKIVTSRLSLHQKQAAEKAIRLETSIEENLPEISIDPDRAGQVADNLIENAIKYSPRNSTVRVSLARAGNELRLEVRDEGAGLTVEQIANLFQAFKTVGTKTTAGERSSGLGLAIVKAIMEEHRGRIEVQSSPGSGAAFIAFFPVENRPGPNAPTKPF